MTHQELFDRWVSAERGVISEYSSHISEDLGILFDEATEYASENGLDFDETKEGFVGFF